MDAMGGGADGIGGGGIGVALTPACAMGRAHCVQNCAASAFWLPQLGQNIAHLPIQGQSTY